MVRLIITFFIAFCFVHATGQGYYNYWHFGDSAGLYFSDSSIVPIENASLFSFEQCATISDSAGNLLFYSNGLRIWNREGETMPYGDSLAVYSYRMGAGSETVQGVLILPMPGSSSLFYVFSLNNCCIPGYDGLIYSVVDMELDEDLGGVVPSQRNIKLLPQSLDEGMMAVRHGNGRDWWLLAKRYYIQDKKYYIFSITPDGIVSVDSLVLGDSDADYTWGPIEFSHDGTRMALGGWQIEVYDFNRCTGELSNPTLLETDSTDGVYYGLAFSPDDSKLYATDVYFSLYQYDLNYQGSDSIARHLVLSTHNPTIGIGFIQTGPDGRLYVPMSHVVWPNDIYSPANMNLTTINLPNMPYPDYDLDSLSVWIGGQRSMLGLPNFPNYDLGPLAGSPCDTIGREDTTEVGILEQDMADIEVFPNPASERIRVVPSAAGEFALYDPLGRRKASRSLNPGETASIDISASPPGLYAWTWTVADRIRSGGSILVLGN